MTSGVLWIAWSGSSFSLWLCRGDLSSKLSPAVRRRASATIMADCPRGLAGTEWLVSQGARHELPRVRQGTFNPELSSNLMYLAMNTEKRAPEDDAAVWQMAYAEERRSKLQAASVDPARMVQYVAGRPCVVPG